MKRALLAMVLLAAFADAAVMGGGGAAGAAVNVLAELVGKNVNATSYTASSTTGPAFVATGDRVDAARLGTHPRATIGPCEPGAPDICVGPNDFGYTSKFRTWGDIIAQGFQVRDNIDILGTAAIVNNSGPVRLNDADGFTINGGTPQRGRIAGSVTFDSAAIGAHDCEPQTVTVTGAALHDITTVSADFQLPKGVGLQGGRVSAVDTLELNLCNNTDGSLNPVSGPYLFELVR